MNEAQEQQQREIDELFERFPKSIDWADDLARTTVTLALQSRSMLEGIRDMSDTQKIAWMLVCSLAPEFRGLRAQARDSVTVRVQGKIDHARKQLREQFAAPDFMADFIRDAAGMLDSKGQSHEANVLRDAAGILDTEF